MLNRFGVVCAFVTNEYMQEGIEALPSNVKVSLKDAELYFTTTKKQISTVLTTNYDELEVTLNNILQASGRIVTEELAVYSHAVSLTNLNDIVTGLDAIKQDLQMIDKITKDLRTNASQLDIGMSYIIFYRCLFSKSSDKLFFFFFNVYITELLEFNFSCTRS